MTYKESKDVIDGLERGNRGFYLWQGMIAHEMSVFAPDLEGEEFERYCDMAYNVFQRVDYCPIEAAVASTIRAKAESEQAVIEDMDEHYCYGEAC